MARWQFLDRFSRGDSTAVGSSPTVAEHLSQPVAEAIYPPNDPGLPACDPDALLGAAADKIARLRELTVSDREHFDSAYLSPIRELARLVHLLPASADGPYSAPAGLFHLCVDVAFFVLQSADGKIFTPDGSVEDRHRNEPRWRYACFLAGLCCQVPRTLTLLTVTSASKQEWPRFTLSLWAWLQANAIDRFFVNWHARASIGTGEGAAVLAAIAPKGRLDWLAQGDVQIVRDMHQVAMGAAHDADSIMAGVVNRIAKRVLEVDDARRRNRYGRLTIGTHVEPYVLDALRAPIENGRWAINSPASPVWMASDGLFIEWPGAHSHVLEHFDRLGLPGLPRSSVTLAEMLGKADLLIQAESGLWVREVLVPESSSGDRRRRTTAMRFVDPTAILGHLQVEGMHGPVGAELVEAEQKAALPPAAAPVRAKQDTPAPQAPTVPATAVQPAPQTPNAVGADQSEARESPREQGTPLPVAEGSDEIVFANLIKPEAKRWITSPDVCEALGHLVHLHSRRRGEAAKSFPFGVALSVDWISENTVADIANLVGILERNRWLGRPTSVKNEALKLHELQFDDGTKRAIVLSTAGATTIGFDVGAKRK